MHFKSLHFHSFIKIITDDSPALAACSTGYRQATYDPAHFHSETNGQWQAGSHTSDTGCLRHHRQ